MSVLYAFHFNETHNTPHRIARSANCQAWSRTSWSFTRQQVRTFPDFNGRYHLISGDRGSNNVESVLLYVLSHSSERDSAIDGRQYQLKIYQIRKFSYMNLRGAAMLVEEPFEFCFWEIGSDASDSSSVQARCKKRTVRVHDIIKHHDIDVFPLSDLLFKYGKISCSSRCPFSPQLRSRQSSPCHIEKPLSLGDNHLRLVEKGFERNDLAATPID